jgi:hypothetical protein
MQKESSADCWARASNQLLWIAGLFLVSSFNLGCAPDLSGSDELGSVRKLLANSPSKLDMCPSANGFNLLNARWMAEFSANQYSHFEVLGDYLEKLGFGARGDGLFYQERAIQLRIKRVEEKIQSQDYSWRTEPDRVKHLKKLRESYASLMGRDYKPTTLSAADYEKQIFDNIPSGTRIRFFNSSHHSQAMFAYHPKLKMAILVFRGTEPDELSDLQADVDFRHVPFQGGMVHSGFLTSLNSILPKINAVLNEQEKYGSYELFIGGHSLGGALATVQTMSFLAKKQTGGFSNIHLNSTYTFGSPRVGDKSFVTKLHQLLKEQNSGMVRFRNHKDPVVLLPIGAPATTGFWHTGALGYFDDKGKLFLGDGNEEVDSKSNMKNSTPGLLHFGEHDITKYLGLIRTQAQKFRSHPWGRCGAGGLQGHLKPYDETKAP